MYQLTYETDEGRKIEKAFSLADESAAARAARQASELFGVAYLAHKVETALGQFQSYSAVFLVGAFSHMEA